jgi:hypothetical protein
MPSAPESSALAGPHLRRTVPTLNVPTLNAPTLNVPTVSRIFADPGIVGKSPNMRAKRAEWLLAWRPRRSVGG